MKQIERTERYLHCIRSFYKGVERPYHSIHGFEDDLVSFFMYCYHIRDWIIHLNKKKLTSRDIDKFINSHMELKICADFCNGTKHCKLTRNTRSNSQPHIMASTYNSFDYASISGSFKPSTDKAKFTILANGKPYDSLELAEKCFELWQYQLWTSIISFKLWVSSIAFCYVINDGECNIEPLFYNSLAQIQNEEKSKVIRQIMGNNRT